MSEADYFAMNRSAWDQRAQVHFGSKFYNVAGFLAGETSLREIERAELTDVAGKRLLHLQCHFGLDTLSWARQGAVCTGVDISSVAIQKARELAAQTRLNTEFVCSDVYGFERTHSEPYDIVFTSYGAICWLPDLTRWAQVVANMSKAPPVSGMPSRICSTSDVSDIAAFVASITAVTLSASALTT